MMRERQMLFSSLAPKIPNTFDVPSSDTTGTKIVYIVGYAIVSYTGAMLHQSFSLRDPTRPGFQTCNTNDIQPTSSNAML